MNRPMKLAAPLLALAVAACSAGGSSGLPTVPAQSAAKQPSSMPDWQRTGSAQRVCADVPQGYAACDALILANKIGPNVEPNIAGLEPTDFQTWYDLPSSTKGSGQVVALVDAYDNPNAASDLQTYRSEFGLGTATFTKYNQDGQTSSYPTADKNWGFEEDLDIEMVSAVCPKCTIDLIEANSNGTSDLETAEAEAVKLGAHIVSNSWGCKGSNLCDNASSFDTAGVVYLASAGDYGYGTQAPAALASVVAVGGTRLVKTGSTYSETTWSGTGSGCATGITKPSWQHDSGCTYRTMNDISAVSWNVAEYDSYGYTGWVTAAGTSVASPMMGGVFALAGNASTRDAAKQFWTQPKKKYKKDLHDITTGSNGSCGGSYLCTAGPGYDGPTGWGTPHGVGAF